MGVHIGQAITWGTAGAPHLFSGVCTGYSYRRATTRQLDADEAGENQAMILHSEKAALDFSAKVTSASTDFLDLSGGCVLTVSGISAGVVGAYETTESWRLGQDKTIGVRATHYPDVTASSPAAAAVTVNAFVPSQSGLTIVNPTGVIIYSTFGLGHAAGVIHALSIMQRLTLQEDEVSPAGTILGFTPVGYLREIQLEILAKSTIPAVKSTLTLTGAPARAANYQIEAADLMYREQRGEMYSVRAVWIPPMGAGS